MARRLFLERRTYRKNRLQDAARLLPVLGMILFFGPVFITGEDGQGAGLAAWLVYLFVTWLCLIVVAMLVSRSLARDAPDPEGAEAVPSRFAPVDASGPAPGHDPAPRPGS
ncbi:hypothetical protein P6F26_06705 [Roseibacterium sp. SDUM158017]|uniref:hypothetical protein n=1 Tax=Roseicyclus salinarum TaxID=3036773 RepID=UPI0024157F77|nr:hypothetical protein [Roseibacterium sp. SDUM158017]MDG4648127.1 hypothetical protein [Roseibacterium sp. SDUM158017]